MKLLYRHLIVFVIVLLVLAVLPTSAHEEAEGHSRNDPRPDPLSYAIRGPYPVGTMALVLTTEERDIPIHVWYPALNPNGVEESTEYILQYPDFAFPPIAGRAIQDAEPDVGNAPYPLVLFSHGLFEHRLSAVYLTEHLASYGFVVLSAEHADNPGTQGVAPMFASFISRPLDITRQIDFAERVSAIGGELENMVDNEHIGVIGHSFGGWTALAAGGAQLDFAGFRRLCEVSPEFDPLRICHEVLGRLEDMASLAGLDTVPEGLWPSAGDPRVDTVVPLAPSGRFFGPAGSKSMRLPMLLMVGSGDRWSIPEANAYPVYEYVGSEQKAMIVFEGADHDVFHFSCDRAPQLTSWGCSDPVWDMDRAHDLINHFTTAFLLATLKDDAAAAAALTPEAVWFPGIRYETTIGQ